MILWIKRLVLLASLFCAIIVGVVFTSENNTPFALFFFGIKLPILSVGLWMSIALFSGAIIGLIISYFSLFFSRYTRTNKDKRIKQLEKELAALRVSGLKGR